MEPKEVERWFWELLCCETTFQPPWVSGKAHISTEVLVSCFPIILLFVFNLSEYNRAQQT